MVKVSIVIVLVLFSTSFLGCDSRSKSSSRSAEYQELTKRLEDAARRGDAGEVSNIGNEMKQRGMSVEEYERLRK